MGTKRFLAPLVVDLIEELPEPGRVGDLFCGTGAVTGALQDTASVLMNDVSTFLGHFLRARYASTQKAVAADLIEDLKPEFDTHLQNLTSAVSANVCALWSCGCFGGSAPAVLFFGAGSGSFASLGCEQFG
ncbi:DNA adenine methylase [Candidatus Poriferisodalis sp.]|uniref:DNA adenine methylase n=1 Tax=Candidatus Poriferisodalis sp. TaxID=3101277 RepID=UPI003D0B5977